MCVMCEVGIVIFIIAFISMAVLFLPEPQRERRDGNYQYSFKERREVLEHFVKAQRRTAKRAAIRRLQAHGGWMFEDAGKKGKWE